MKKVVDETIADFFPIPSGCLKKTQDFERKVMPAKYMVIRVDYKSGLVESLTPAVGKAEADNFITKEFRGGPLNTRIALSIAPVAYPSPDKNSKITLLKIERHTQ